MSEMVENPRDVREDDFPVEGTPAEKLRFLLNYAVLAPSNRNTQPWRWEVVGSEAALYADRSRALPAVDPAGRELIMSCGAALQHLRLAIRAFGYTDIIAFLPEPEQPDLLAYVRMTGSHRVSLEELALFHAIPERHTNRHLFDQRPVPATLQDRLRIQASQSGVWLHLVEDLFGRTALIELIAQGDVEQGHDANIRRDLAHWMIPNRSVRRDGIPGYALGLNNVISLTAPLTMRLLDKGEAQAEKDWMLAGSAPVLGVLGTNEDTLRDWLAAGEALARVLLYAQAAGLAASFFNQPIEVEKLWPQVRHILGRGGFPQLLFRLGYAPEGTAPTPRRAVDEVLHEP